VPLSEAPVPPGSVPITEPQCLDYSVFHSNREGDWDLFRLGEFPGNPTADENITRYVPPPNVPDLLNFNIAPSFSPNQEWVVFVSNRDDNWELYAARVDGTFQQRLTYNRTAADLHPSWSPTGEWIAFESNRDGNWDIWLFNIFTGEERRVTFNSANDVNASWAPDGESLVFSSDRTGLWQMFLFDLNTGAEVYLSDGSGDDHDPVFSPDGEFIAFRSFRDGLRSVIYIMRADGTEVRRVSDFTGDAIEAVWSPDSSKVLYTSTLDGDRELYVYDLDRLITQQLTDNNVSDDSPAWKCDGSGLLFVSDRTGKPDVFLIETPPTTDILVERPNAIQLTFDTSPNMHPLSDPSDEVGSREQQFPSPENRNR
jgi:Tol biopolymer transport system component